MPRVGGELYTIYYSNALKHKSAKSVGRYHIDVEVISTFDPLHVLQLLPELGL